jgi:hypothetical protein
MVGEDSKGGITVIVESIIIRLFFYICTDLNLVCRLRIESCVECQISSVKLAQTSESCRGGE